MSTTTQVTPDLDDIDPPHPGLLWLDDMACAELDDQMTAAQAQEALTDEGAATPQTGALSLYFVDAGHVISEETLNVCRACPVRRECIIHAYKGGPGGTPVVGGYMGGFSLGQRKAMTLQQALERAKNDPPRPVRRKNGS